MAPVAVQTQLQMANKLQGETCSDTTPMPLQREALDETPEALSADAGKADVPPAPVRSFEKLPQLDLWEGEVPVKDTFVHFTTITPGTRATTQLSGDTEPKDFAPNPFSFLETQTLESPAAICELDAFAPAGRSTRRVIQLNLDVWIPRTSTAADNTAAPLVRVAEHHFPAPSATRSDVSNPAEPAVPLVRLSEHHFPAPSATRDGTSSEPVCRRLFHHNTV